MRLQEQYILLNKAINVINEVTYERDGQITVVININKLQKSLVKISNFNYLKNEIHDFLLDHTFVNSIDEPKQYNFQVIVEFKKKIDLIKYRIQIAIEMISSIIPQEKDNMISIKLPKTTDLKTITDDINLFDQVLNQVLTREKNASTVTFSNFDLGSNWITIILQTSGAVSFVGSLVWAACVIRKKKIEGDLLVESLKGLKLKNEGLEDVVKLQKEMIRDTIKKEAENLIINNELSDSDPEYLGRVVNSIDKLSSIIQRGAIIQPSLLKPEQVKNLYPNFNKLETIESKLELLEQK